jgi:two-component system CheB/CheR fusion protein
MSDIGRPIGDIRLRIKGINLEHLLAEVMRTRTEKVLEIEDDDDCWHKLIVKPYQTALNVIEGAVVIFLNINECKLV